MNPFMPPYGQAPGRDTFAVNGPVDVIIPKPTPGIPPSAMPPVMIRPVQPQGQANMMSGMMPLPPQHQVGGVPYAQSFPLSNQSAPFPPLPEIPSPESLAPWLYYSPPRSAAPVMPPGPNGNYQNNYYNNMNGMGSPYGYPYPPGPYPPGPYPPQGPNPYQQPPVAKPPEIKPPDNKPPETKAEEPKPEEKKPEEKKPDEKKADEKSKVEDFNAATMTPEFVRSLNQQLNDPSPNVRSLGAMEFYRFLETNPTALENKQFKEYIDAFVMKILSDPSALVRQPLLLAIEMEYLKGKDMPKAARHVLEGIANGQDTKWNTEPSQVRSLLPLLDKPRELPATEMHAPDAMAAVTPPVKFGARLNLLSEKPKPTARPDAPSGKRLNLVSYS